MAELIAKHLRYPNGEPVATVIADYVHRRVGPKHRLRGEVPPRKCRRVAHPSPPLWCYGSETMDMDPLIPKAVWGFNGTERPGAVYLAAV